MAGNIRTTNLRYFTFIIDSCTHTQSFPHPQYLTPLAAFTHPSLLKESKQEVIDLGEYWWAVFAFAKFLLYAR